MCDTITGTECDLAKSRRLGISPLELEFLNKPQELRLLKQFPGMNRYEYEDGAIYEIVYGVTITSRDDIKAAGREMVYSSLWEKYSRIKKNNN